MTNETPEAAAAGAQNCACTAEFACTIYHRGMDDFQVYQAFHKKSH